MIYKGIIDRYRKYLPVSDKTPIVTLYEGNTPLLRARNLEKFLKVNSEIYLKFEGMNPTGSFKDRGMTMAISKAVEEGSKAVICASTGNTAASAAAYSARAGLKCSVVIPDGSIALGKLSQAMMHGAKVIALKGNFDEALKIVIEITKNYPITLVNSVNPYRIEGQKTAAFEIIDFLGRAPDYHFIPVGNAGNITAYWKGYKEYANDKSKLKVKSKRLKLSPNLSTFLPFPARRGETCNLPHMMGFQASGSAPIVKGKPIKNPKTIATAIKIGNPASWKKAEEARDESKGVIDMVTDSEIIKAYRLLASLEGVFVEPASAASVAGLIKFNSKINIQKSGCVIVCTVTGHGLKDPDRAIKSAKQPKVLEPNIKKIISAIEL
ncbi:MAG: threonine synthase [Elusimicrobia bacterium RIFOXYD2_FULL_34_15]|nr:MAG: threonine synthase [Elusimicrobia bacterium RIFOXYD2_FULL_34_15]